MTTEAKSPADNLLYSYNFNFLWQWLLNVLLLKNKLKYFAKRIGVLVLAATLAVGTFFERYGQYLNILMYRSEVSPNSHQMLQGLRKITHFNTVIAFLSH